MFFLNKNTLKCNRQGIPVYSRCAPFCHSHMLSSPLFDFKASAPTRHHTNVHQAPACSLCLQQNRSVLPMRLHVHSKIGVHWEREGPSSDKMSPLFSSFFLQPASVNQWRVTTCVTLIKVNRRVSQVVIVHYSTYGGEHATLL